MPVKPLAIVCRRLLEPYARRTRRVVELPRLVTHIAGGRPAGRVMARLGVPQSKDTLLRALKRGARNRAGAAPVRVVGIDDWSWRKGTTYGTIVVDLERREVLDILQDRSAESTSGWLRRHPAVEMVSRDRCGLYAQGCRPRGTTGSAGGRPLPLAAEFCGTPLNSSSAAPSVRASRLRRAGRSTFPNRLVSFVAMGHPR